jgi:hypothetical protein
VAGVYLGKRVDFSLFGNPIKAIEWLNEGNVPELIFQTFVASYVGDEFLRS